MSRRQRTSERKNADPNVMQEARNLIANGNSKRKVAEMLGMPESTLRKRLKQDSVPESLGRFKCTFNKEMELELVEHVRDLDERFFGVTPKQFRRLAYEFAEKNEIEHQFNKESKIAGKDWLRGFMKRHPSLSLRQPTSTSIARAMGFNKPQVERFYTNLSSVYDKYNFPPHRVFNMDESGFSTVPNKPPKVISTKGKRCVNKISSAERGQNVTAVCAMSASGQYIPPTFIFKRKRMKAELLDNAPPSSIGMVSDSSFITSDLFLLWIQHFKDHVKPTQEEPVLLILDNHSSHCTLAAVNFCRENHIVLLSLPPHSSHRMQPLDRCFFSPLKKYYSVECENWMRNHPGRTITTFQITSIFAPAYAKTATIANAIEGFKVTGIWPFNNEIFSDADFLASSVTERPVEPQNIAPDMVIPSNEDGNSFPNLPAEPPHHTEDRALLPIEEDLLEAAKNMFLPEKNPQDSLPLSSGSLDMPSTSKTSFIKITELSPFPKSSVQRACSKRSKRSEILSSSPNKRQLEVVDAAKNAKSQKTKRVTKQLVTTKQLTTTKRLVSTKKQIWTCSGCSEIYKEPLTEDWIECITCKNWWHEKCTDYCGLGAYECDLCD